jgi:hypothetical protein
MNTPHRDTPSKRDTRPHVATARVVAAAPAAMALVAYCGRPSSPTEPSTRSNPFSVPRHRPPGNRAPAAVLEISTFEVNFGNINQGYYLCVPKVMVTENWGRGPRSSKVLSSACRTGTPPFWTATPARPQLLRPFPRFGKHFLLPAPSMNFLHVHRGCPDLGVSGTSRFSSSSQLSTTFSWVCATSSMVGFSIKNLRPSRETS